MKDVFNEYLKSTEEMRAILALRSPEEAAYDKEVGGGLKKAGQSRRPSSARL